MKKERNLYGYEDFNEFLLLSEDGGQLINKVDRHKSEKGKTIGSLNIGGYFVFKLFGHWWFNHRVVWLLHFKKWPEKLLDHIDGNPANNSVGNLRQATCSQNQHNSKKRCNSKSNQKCICFHKLTNKWMVTVVLNRKRYYGGLHENLEDVIKARDKLVTQLHGDFANLS